MVPKGGRLLVAVSGGSDSVALTLLLHALQERGELAIAGIGHLNHALRVEATADEDFCRDFASALNVPFHSATVDVRARARDERTSIEDAGRRARYEFLAAAAVEADAQAIATGHTLDDQAETFLIRVIRGAGPRGLAGVFPVAGKVVRPLIEARRVELKSYLEARGQAYRDDASNRDLTIQRNRIRHELIPLLERDYSPNIVEVLAREAAIAREDEDYLQQKAIDSAETIVLRSSGGGHEVDVEALKALHPAIAARIAQRVLAVASDRFIGFDHIQRFLAFVRGDAEAARCDAAAGSRVPPALSLPGVQARRRGSRVVLARERQEPFTNSFEFPLSIPGEVTLASSGWTISAAAVNPAVSEGVPAGASTMSVLVKLEPGAQPLTVRSRRRGDRLRPAGLGGRGKKLQDLLVDRKVPREQRDSVPLVVDGDGRIVWVVGLAVAEDFRVTEPLQGVILLKARRLGGPG
jgi:tRNA(Ile)-lysidine synthase